MKRKMIILIVLFCILLVGCEEERFKTSVVVSKYDVHWKSGGPYGLGAGHPMHTCYLHVVEIKTHKVVELVTAESTYNRYRIGDTLVFNTSWWKHKTATGYIFREDNR